ncbi:MAG: glutamate ligase domain-containing protein, partial [Candidatus Binatia bacterium]
PPTVEQRRFLERWLASGSGRTLVYVGRDYDASIDYWKKTQALAPIEQALEEFPGLEHRLEFVREKDGVRYYNDSKGTNVGAVAKSLASFSAPVILLAGGVDKGGDYAPLAAGVKNQVRRLVLFGAAKQTIAAALGQLTTTVLVNDIAAAVGDAVAHAQPGDVVLLSPACSSFDQFRNYAERGKSFKNLVQAL